MFQFRYNTLLLFCVLGVLALIWGCSQKKAVQSNSVVIFLEKSVDSIDPAYSGDESSGIVISSLFRKLYHSNLEGQLRKDLVKTEKINRGQVTLELNRTAFANNSMVSAFDVKYCLDRVKSVGRRSWVISEIEKIEVLTKFRLRLFLKAKSNFNELRLKLSMPTAAIYSRKAHQNNKFVVSKGSRLVFYSSEKIKIMKSGRMVEFRVVKNDTARWFSFQRELVDVYQAKGVYSILGYNSKVYQKVVVPTAAVNYGAIVIGKKNKKKSKKKNSKKGRSKLLGDQSFRQAINSSLNRRALCEKTLLNNYIPADYPVPPILFKQLEPYYRYKTKTSKKKKYLSNKWGNESVEIYTVSDRDKQLMAMAISNAVNRLGIKTKLTILDFSTLKKFNLEQRPGIYVFTWFADYSHPNNFLEALFHSRHKNSSTNRAHFADTELDQLLDLAKVNDDYIEAAQKKVQELAPWVFIGFPKKYYFLKKQTHIRIPVSYTGWYDAFKK